MSCDLTGLQVERACLVIRSAVASSLAWEDIAAFVKDAQMRRDPVAMTIDKLKLNEGLITLLLRQVLDLSPVSLCHSGVTLCHLVVPTPA